VGGGGTVPFTFSAPPSRTFRNRYLLAQAAVLDPAGGPLTLTDVNLLLGRLDAERLAIPVDVAAARRALDRLVADLVRERAGRDGGEVEPDELLLGCLAIADERMADAVRRISVARGYDPADSTLVAFGGAGGQHACSLAELLGISTVLIPEDAGLLSAVGLDAAVVERFAERQVLRTLSETGDGLGRLLEELDEEARRAVAIETAGPVEVRRRLMHLRLAGQETSLEIELAGSGSVSESAVRAAFADAYRDLYGYPPPERPVEIESVRVVASQMPPEVPPEVPGTSVSVVSPEVYQDSPEVPGTSHELPGTSGFGSRFDRAALPVGARFAGPALVFEAHSATVVLAGWSGTKDEAGALVLRREETP
jgi:5-oxoprolinase (ATP-hydrolysing)